MLNCIICQTLGIVLLVSVITFIASIYAKYLEKQLSKREPFIYLGKLDDSYTNDNIDMAVKYLKLTNGINSTK